MLIGPLAITYASVGPVIETWWAVPAALWCAVPAAILWASYAAVPGSGRWVDAGCSPCAAVSGVTVVGSLVMRAMAPLDLGIAVVAGLIVAFGLLQRVGTATSCATPGR